MAVCLDYVYTLSPAFIIWLENHRPGALEAIRAADFEPDKYVVSCRAYLDDRLNATKHVLLFPSLLALTAQQRISFDNQLGDRGDPVIILTQHPDDVAGSVNTA